MTNSSFYRNNNLLGLNSPSYSMVGHDGAQPPLDNNNNNRITLGPNVRGPQNKRVAFDVYTARARSRTDERSVGRWVVVGEGDREGYSTSPGRARVTACDTRRRRYRCRRACITRRVRSPARRIVNVSLCRFVVLSTRAPLVTPRI